MLKTDSQTDSRSTTHVFVGLAAEVDFAVAELMRYFPPEGYCTFLKKRDTLPDGQTKATVFRFNSCD